MPSGFKQDLSIGQNLRRLREANHLTQPQVIGLLAKYGIDISREILSQMENGRHSIKISVLIALKDIYKTTYDEFFLSLTTEDVKDLFFENISPSE